MLATRVLFCVTFIKVTVSIPQVSIDPGYYSNVGSNLQNGYNQRILQGLGNIPSNPNVLPTNNGFLNAYFNRGLLQNTSPLTNNITPQPDPAYFQTTPQNFIGASPINNAIYQPNAFTSRNIQQLPNPNIGQLNGQTQFLQNANAFIQQREDTQIKQQQLDLGGRYANILKNIEINQRNFANSGQSLVSQSQFSSQNAVPPQQTLFGQNSPQILNPNVNQPPPNIQLYNSQLQQPTVAPKTFTIIHPNGTTEQSDTLESVKNYPFFVLQKGPNGESVTVPLSQNFAPQNDIYAKNPLGNPTQVPLFSPTQTPFNPSNPYLRETVTPILYQPQFTSSTPLPSITGNLIANTDNSVNNIPSYQATLPENNYASIINSLKNDKLTPSYTGIPDINAVNTNNAGFNVINSKTSPSRFGVLQGISNNDFENVHQSTPDVTNNINNINIPINNIPFNQATIPKYTGINDLNNLNLQKSYTEIPDQSVRNGIYGGYNLVNSENPLTPDSSTGYESSNLFAPDAIYDSNYLQEKTSPSSITGDLIETNDNSINNIPSNQVTIPSNDDVNVVNNINNNNTPTSYTKLPELDTINPNNGDSDILYSQKSPTSVLDEINDGSDDSNFDTVQKSTDLPTTDVIYDKNDSDEESLQPSVTDDLIENNDNTFNNIPSNQVPIPGNDDVNIVNDLNDDKVPETYSKIPELDAVYANDGENVIPYSQNSPTSELDEINDGGDENNFDTVQESTDLPTPHVIYDKNDSDEGILQPSVTDDLIENNDNTFNNIPSNQVPIPGNDDVNIVNDINDDKLPEEYGNIPELDAVYANDGENVIPYYQNSPTSELDEINDGNDENNFDTVQESTDLPTTDVIYDKNDSDEGTLQPSVTDDLIENNDNTLNNIPSNQLPVPGNDDVNIVNGINDDNLPETYSNIPELDAVYANDGENVIPYSQNSPTSELDEINDGGDENNFDTLQESTDLPTTDVIYDNNDLDEENLQPSITDDLVENNDNTFNNIPSNQVPIPGNDDVNIFDDVNDDKLPKRYTDIPELNTVNENNGDYDIINSANSPSDIDVLNNVSNNNDNLDNTYESNNVPVPNIVYDNDLNEEISQPIATNEANIDEDINNNPDAILDSSVLPIQDQPEPSGIDNNEFSITPSSEKPSIGDGENINYGDDLVNLDEDTTPESDILNNNSDQEAVGYAPETGILESANNNRNLISPSEDQTNLLPSVDTPENTEVGDLTENASDEESWNPINYIVPISSSEYFQPKDDGENINDNLEELQLSEPINQEVSENSQSDLQEGNINTKVIETDGDEADDITEVIEVEKQEKDVERSIKKKIKLADDEDDLDSDSMMYESDEVDTTVTTTTTVEDVVENISNKQRNDDAKALYIPNVSLLQDTKGPFWFNTGDLNAWKKMARDSGLTLLLVTPQVNVDKNTVVTLNPDGSKVEEITTTANAQQQGIPVVTKITRITHPDGEVEERIN